MIAGKYMMHRKIMREIVKASEHYVEATVKINFCHMCGRKLTDGDDAEKNEMEACDE